MAKNILILLGHPDNVGMGFELIDAYEDAAKAAGHNIERYNIGEMQFDPILHHGYRAIQELEPDLVRFQESIKKADHFVIAYPNWWSGPPAILKGFFERVWLPGFAYRYMRWPSGKRSIFWRRLLKGKTARVIITTGVNPLLLRAVYGNMTVQISIAILWFAGFRVSETFFGRAENPSEAKKARWLACARSLGRRGI